MSNPTIKSVEDFLFRAPLYKNYDRQNSHPNITNELFARREKDSSPPVFRYDGYCKWCKREVTWIFTGFGLPAGFVFGQFLRPDVFKDPILFRTSCEIQCARDPHHTMYFYILCDGGNIMKIGQYPSLYDIASGEARIYAKEMKEDDFDEFKKAILLATHGTGVASFVYLRRVFERLIHRKFEEHQQEESWDREAFEKSRFDQKINMIAKHLPRSLVETSRIYAVLSAGIHELEEEKCLEYFEIIRQAIMMILDDDHRLSEERKARESLMNAVAGIKI